MAKYATKEQVTAITSPAADVTVDDLTYRLAAITRGEFRWAMDTVGYVENPVTGKNDSADPEMVDMLMLATSLIEPDFDAEDEADIATLQEMPIGVSSKLIKQMMTLSSLGVEDPTAPTEE
ncbi:hypothetical protein LCGC14_2884090 [marine sediment metagenome]|uniref:Tail assembly chaperone n=1 Tax=marine sediment metagenome TaxID=412755 RepID=A0A0F8YL26_9ZZZZ